MKRYPFLRTIRYSFRYLNAGIVVCCFAGAGFVLGGLDQLNMLMPSADELSAYRPRLTTEIYSTETHKDGTETHTLLARVFEEDREPVELREVPRAMQKATIAIEDRRFDDHPGISPRDMVRAAWVDLQHKDIVQGASTITQQLVRNVWLTRERTWDRKLKEAMLALEVERKYSKDEILEMYLNQVCYGHGAFGVKTAARMYFGKAPGGLELHECAMLAGLPQWPVGYSPYRHPERCRTRRNAVLAWMQREGYISPKEREAAAETPIQEGLQPLQERGVVAKHAPHFTHMVIRELCGEYGFETIWQGGLRVYTTLDLRVQEVAEEELTRQVEALRRRGNLRRGLAGQGALACVEVRTGRVLAMVGGVGAYEELQVNLAHPGAWPHGQQPGSSFKPYVWAAALESGYGPESVFSADPIAIKTGPRDYWTPRNYTSAHTGNFTLRHALAQSVNLVSVRIVRKLSIAKVRRMAARMLDIPVERLKPYWSIALGASELSPLEQALGYCAFANSGLHPTRRLVRRIENLDGRLLVSYEPELVRVIRSTTASSMLSMLRGVVQSGTGTRARSCGLPCGGKTGTTNDKRDVWYVGFTPDLATAIWIGNQRNQPMPGAAGGRFCAPVWANVTKRATDILGCHGEFPQGPGVTAELRGDPSTATQEFVTICLQTGLRATAHCPSTKEVPLAPGEKPPPFCDVHTGPEGSSERAETQSAGGTVSVRICPSSGLLATPYCPASRLRRFRAGEQPTAHCTLHGPWSMGDGPQGLPGGSAHHGSPGGSPPLAPVMGPPPSGEGGSEAPSPGPPPGGEVGPGAPAPEGGEPTAPTPTEGPPPNAGPPAAPPPAPDGQPGAGD